MSPHAECPIRTCFTPHLCTEKCALGADTDAKIESEHERARHRGYVEPDGTDETRDAYS